jgi:hypothetical protein
MSVLKLSSPVHCGVLLHLEQQTALLVLLTAVAGDDEG